MCVSCVRKNVLMHHQHPSINKITGVFDMETHECYELVLFLERVCSYIIVVINITYLSLLF